MRSERRRFPHGTRKYTSRENRSKFIGILWNEIDAHILFLSLSFSLSFCVGEIRNSYFPIYILFIPAYFILRF